MRVGILGGGQLGRMLGQAGIPLGIETTFLEASREACARAVGALVVATYDDPSALAGLAAGADVVTWEFENVPVESARWLQKRVHVRPPPEALDRAQDRLTEKRLFAELGIPTTRFRPVDDSASLHAAVAELGLPSVLKTRRSGYDGKGQAVLVPGSDVDAAFTELGARPSILEASVSFQRELSIIGVRDRLGRIAFWPVVETHHETGMLRWCLAPAPDAADVQARAERICQAVLERLDYIGVLAVELFQTQDSLLANEMAPRVHNSGHWTIEGALTSQFENHLRAVIGWPLGEPTLLAHAATVNLIGVLPPAEALLAVPGARVHLYGKAPRPMRKLGHVTVLGRDAAERDARLEAVRAVIADAGG